MGVFAVLVTTIIGVLGTASSAQGQTFLGGVRGILEDDNGGILVGVQIKLENEEIGGLRSTVSNAAGEYSFANLQPGRYTLSAGENVVAVLGAKIDAQGARIEAEIKAQTARIDVLQRVIWRVIWSVRLPRFAAVWCKSFVFSSFTYKEGFGFAFSGGVSPPLPVVSLLFSVSYPQARRSYYLFFTTCMGVRFGTRILGQGVHFGTNLPVRECPLWYWKSVLIQTSLWK